MFKKILKDLLNSRFALSFLVGFLIVILYHFVVFPGLTVENTIINIGSAVIGVLSLLFIYFYVKNMYFNDDFELFTPDPNKEPETELDYNPPPKTDSKKSKTRRKYSNNQKNKNK
jgi:hypothetical protein